MLSLEKMNKFFFTRLQQTFFGQAKKKLEKNEEKNFFHINDNAHYIRFDWATKHILRDKTDFSVVEVTL